MATQLFFRSVLQPYRLLAKNSNVMPNGTNRGGNGQMGLSGGSLTACLMSTTVSSQANNVAVTNTCDTSNTNQSGCMGTWASKPLAAQTISAQNWTLGLQGNESSTNMNAFWVVTIGVWRPSTQSVVGYIYDATTQLGSELGTADSGRVITVAGSEVTAVDGDVLFCNVWWRGTPTMSTSFTCTFKYDGTAAVTAAGAQFGSYLQSTNDLTFSSTKWAGSIFFFDGAAPSVSPGEGQHGGAPALGPAFDMGVSARALLTSQTGATPYDLTGTASSGLSDSFMTSFSIPLGAQTIAQGLMMVYFWNRGSNQNGSPCARVYIWRPSSNAIVAGTNLNFVNQMYFQQMPTSTNPCPIVGYADMGGPWMIQNNDLLVVELWYVNPAASETCRTTGGGSAAIEDGVRGSASSASGVVTSATSSDWVSYLMTEKSFALASAPSVASPLNAGSLIFRPQFLRPRTRRV